MKLIDLNDLERKTRAYWDLSICWRQGKGFCTVEQANKAIRTIRSNTGPHRKLRQLIDVLAQEIIYDQKTPKGIDDTIELDQGA